MNSVSDLLQAAEAHCARIIEQEGAEPTMARLRRREEVRVLFLFPDLTDYERHLLAHLREWRLMTMLACNGDPAEHEAEDEEIACKAENGFMDAKMAVLQAGIQESSLLVRASGSRCIPTSPEGFGRGRSTRRL